MYCSPARVLSFAATLSLALPLCSQAPTTLVVLPPGLTYARAVSADGLTVVGSGGAQVARWTAAGGVVLLGVVPGDTGAAALAVNGDGSVLVGVSDNSWFGTMQAMQHVGGSNAVSLGFLPGRTHSLASDVNHDGTIVVGDSSGGAFPQTAARWHVGVITQLASLDPAQNCWATGVDASGWAIAGTSYVSSVGPQQQHAVRWFHGVIADLGALPGRTSSEALAISDDGLVVVGNSWNTAISGGHLNERAFRWVSNANGGTLQDLGLPRSSTSARLHCLSAHGRVAGGAAYHSGQGYVAALWTAERGWIDLGYLLAQLNVSLGGAQLTEVVSLSADGTTLLCSTATGGHVLLQNLPLGGFAKRATGCGDLEIDHWGLPRPGRTVGFSLWNGTGFRGLVAGTPASIPLPQCPGCTAGVSGVTTAESINLQVPNHPSMIGVQLAFQGFDIGTGPCLGAVRLSDTVDVTIQ